MRSVAFLLMLGNALGRAPSGRKYKVFTDIWRLPQVKVTAYHMAIPINFIC